jgi:TolB-like protein/class 3 adenylate cyclase/Flp pilus assembly protein TadD
MTAQTDTPTAAPTRELAAIMFSDVVGFTALMGRDEAKGFQAIAEHREHLRAILPKYNGRLVGEIGDGTLSSFHSVVEAIGCARELQSNLVSDPELCLRVGIHLGDVLYTDKTVLGDGVNVASRIHALAPPGGICISEHVFDEIRNKPGYIARDLGRKQLKNVSRPIRVYSLLAGADPSAATTLVAPPALLRRVPLGVALALALVAATLVGYWRILLRPVEHSTAIAPSGKVTLAVLPFANMSGAKDDEYFTDGMAEEIRGDLAKISGMQVTARTSAYEFKDKNEDVKKIGKLLSVRNVLEGSVRRAAGRVRIEVELIDTLSGFTVWSDRYDEVIEDVFAIQSSVAEAVARELTVKLLPSVKSRIDRRPTANQEAYDLYLKGRYFVTQLSEDGWTKAVDSFEKAIALDPGFAQAYVGLGQSYGTVSDFVMSPRQAIPKARAALERALTLDPNLADAHGTLAYWVLYGYDWNWSAAEKEFKLALDLDPSSAETHRRYCDFLDRMGRVDEAMVQADRAAELDPLSVETILEKAFIYRDSRQNAKALEAFQQVVDRAPNSPFGYMGKGMVYFATGNYDAARPQFEKCAEKGRSPFFDQWIAVVNARTGRRSDALKLLDRIKAESSHRYVNPVTYASIYWNLGEKDQAFFWLNKAYDERSFFMTNLNLPMFDPLRSDPRFTEVVHKVGLPQLPPRPSS